MNDGMIADGQGSDEWETPDWLFKALDAEFGFDHDGAATEANTKIKDHYTSADDERLQWGGRVFCNPPYSNIERFVIAALNHPCTSVLLLPSRTDTSWFKRLSESPRVKFRWFRKRIRFCLGGKEANSPRFGSLVAIVRPR